MALPNPADESRPDPLAYRACVVGPLAKRRRVERDHHSKEGIPNLLDSDGATLRDRR